MLQVSRNKSSSSIAIYSQEQLNSNFYMLESYFFSLNKISLNFLVEDFFWADEVQPGTKRHMGTLISAQIRMIPCSEFVVRHIIKKIQGGATRSFWIFIQASEQNKSFSSEKISWSERKLSEKRLWAEYHILCVFCRKLKGISAWGDACRRVGAFGLLY